MEKIVTDFESIVLKLASPEKILGWSFGEITKPETINYRTQRPERNGLFDERIFGPEKDYECYCGKYRRIRYKGIICEKCGVEVTRSIVRRERMGHIALAVPVTHIWFVRSIPSRLGLILNISIAELEKVIYFAGYIITSVNDTEKAKIKTETEKEYKAKLKTKTGDAREDLKKIYTELKNQLESIYPNKVLSEVEYRNLSLKYGEIFEVETGAEGLYKICKDIDLKKLQAKITADVDNSSSTDRPKHLKRLKLVNSMYRAGIRPEWMFLTVIPVTPPALRPMVPLEGGRHATSDVNDLYRRVINRNNRLKKLLDLRAPEVITRNEKRILQEAVDALIDNSIRRTQKSAISQAQRRPLKSLADMLKGKQGRFRQNLLGKRVDYSGRSVIVVGPELSLHQCGLPKHMALELFRPFVIAKLIKRELAYNIRGANKLIDEHMPEVWAILEEVIKNRFVLLNRAPTLHRLGIQAFQPVLIEGNAIQVHPLVCTAFNADFDGDQMAVHVPLSEEAQNEARDIMLSSKNLLSPGNGNPIVKPTQDIVLGCFWMTQIMPGAKGEGKIFSSLNEAITANDFGAVNIRAKIKVMAAGNKAKYKKFKGELFETTVGRLLFNSVLPSDFEFVNEKMTQKRLVAVVDKLILQYGEDKTPQSLDKIKSFGYRYATKSGISWGYRDLKMPKEKESIVAETKKEVKLIEDNYKEGLLTENERYQKFIEAWEDAGHKIDKVVPDALDEYGPVRSMVNSSARGSWGQISQMTGWKGQVVNPAGRTIDFPVISSYKEGLSVLEYFISTHGARKGLADTALKTAKAGYLTRRLVDVAQDITVIEEDCKTKKGITIKREDLKKHEKSVAAYIDGRILANAVQAVSEGKTREFKRNHLFNAEDSIFIEASNINEITLRSPITCESIRGICQSCYGKDLGRNKLVEKGEAVGVVAAQSIGEPGTQLTMRTFHMGGVAGRGDITQGLPRIEEIFEMHKPKSVATLSDFDGVVSGITKVEHEHIITILTDEISTKTKAKNKEKEYKILPNREILVKEGEKVTKGKPLTDGSFDIAELFKLCGQEKAQEYIITEIDKVYSTQGANINAKHIEVIARKMFARVKVKKAGDTKFSEGQLIERDALLEENKIIEDGGGEPAKEISAVCGIKKAALTSSSFLSSASFQDTTRILIQASLSGAEDKLRGLKENVMIGRLIPAGTGFKKDRPAKTEEKEEKN